MAHKDTKNTSELPSFLTIKEHERRSVTLRAEGKTMQQITAHINTEFALNYTVEAVKAWFFAGGRLEQAYHEYLEALAASSLREARQLIRRSTKAAVANVISKISSPDERVSLDASKTIMNKYVPDKQVMLDGSFTEDDIPDELASLGDRLLEEEDSSGSEPVDHPPEGGPTDLPAGA